ncbi:MAG: hypothetical protein Sapg2KO_50980 [Saprospiraceae bacterium]
MIKSKSIAPKKVGSAKTNGVFFVKLRSYYFVLSHLYNISGQKAHKPGKMIALNQILLPLTAGSTLDKPFQIKIGEKTKPSKK